MKLCHIAPIGSARYRDHEVRGRPRPRQQDHHAFERAEHECRQDRTTLAMRTMPATIAGSREAI